MQPALRRRNRDERAETSRSARGVACAVALLVLGACAPDDPPPLRIGINPWPGYEFAFLAQELGFFEAEGVAVRMVEFSSLGDTRRAYERGQTDGFFGTLIEVVQAQVEGRRSPQVVLVVDFSAGADVLLAQPDIADVAALRGRRVGVELGSINVYVLARALDRAGLALTDVEIVNIPLESMSRRFRERSVDALVTYPPVSLDLLRDGSARILFSSAEIPGEVVDVLAVDRAIVAERDRDVAAFLRAFGRAQEYAAHHEDEAFAIMAGREGVTAADFAAALRGGIELVHASDQQRFAGPQGALRTLVDRVSRVLVETGQSARPAAGAEIVPAPPRS